MKNVMLKSWLISSIGFILAATPLASMATTVMQKKISNGGNMLVPSGKGWGVKSEHQNPITKNSAIPQNGIFYHGGPVMGTTSNTIPNIYYIWYGNWSGNTAINLLANLALGIGKTYNYNINSTYTDGNGSPVQRIVKFPKPGIFDHYSHGQYLRDSSIHAIVKKAIKEKKLPLDPNGIYFVLTSADVDETSGFCTSYCGWHSYTIIENTYVKYAFVGNPDRCLSSCAEQTKSPNDNPGADGMANVIAHELEESVTDPYLNAWYDYSGDENADKCAWQFGATKIAPNGSRYNMTIAFKHYLVQMNWLNISGGKCANGRIAT
jgi:hypothetical protein